MRRRTVSRGKHSVRVRDRRASGGRRGVIVTLPFRIGDELTRDPYSRARGDRERGARSIGRRSGGARAGGSTASCRGFVHGTHAPGRNGRRWPDLSDSSRQNADARFESIDKQLRAIDPTKLRKPEQIVVENLIETIAARRAQAICRYELWAGSNQFSGWHIQSANIARTIPVNTEQERAAALQLFRDLPAAIVAEQSILRRGLDSGYTMAAPVARSLVEQVQGLLASDVTESKLFLPAQRTTDSQFRDAWRALLVEKVFPAARAYAAFLANDYAPRARGAGSLSALTNGRDCYASSLHAQASTPVDLAALMKEAREDATRRIADLAPLARRLTGQADVAEAMRALRAGAGFTFPSRDSILPAYRAMTDRAAELFSRVVGGVSAEALNVVPYPEFQEKTGLPPAYSAASADGSTAAQFLVNLGRTERMSVADATAHEAYPGHHLQRIAATRAPLVHPAMSTLFFGGFVEGWGIYSEVLGDEMGRYESDLDRVGYLIHMADVALACYLDIGAHTRGWTREVLVDTMMVVGGRPRANAEAYADRHAATPGQLATYFIGFNEIMRARAEAQARLGARFDERRFNQAIISDGTTSLVSMRRRMAGWSP